MKKLFWSGLLVSLVLAGCASGVKLDDVPVEDKSATSSGVSVQGVGVGQGGAQTGVVSLTADKAGQGQGPVGVAHVVYFDYDSFVIKSEFQSVLDAQARYLKADKNRKASIEGHTDERGGREYNLALGQKRAEAVRRALGLLGVADAQLDAVSYGKEKPAATGSDEAALAKNRRAEVPYRP